MTQQTMFLKNTETFAESLARCGVKFHFAYPITPATDVMKRMAVILPQYGGKMLQMESELAVSSALAGAACTGMLCATSSSGPGMTLMQEAISFMCGAELPCLMLDSMRVGPGDGDILGAQSDYYMSTRGGGHGDYHVPVLAPSDGQEIVDLVPEGIRLAYTYRTPVLFVFDGVTAQTTETAVLPEYHDYSAEYRGMGKFVPTKKRLRSKRGNKRRGDPCGRPRAAGRALPTLPGRRRRESGR